MATEPTPSSDGTEELGLEPLDEQTCWERLSNSPLGRLAVVHQDRPHIVPINHLVDDHTIVFVSLPGTKLNDVLDKPGVQVVYEVDGHDDATETGWSVIVTGEAHPITDLVEQARLDRLGRPSWVRDHHEPTWVRIDATSVTGRRIDA